MYYASVTLLLRSHYDKEDSATHTNVVYADSDAAATLLRPTSRRWSCAFVALLYSFYIKSAVQLIYVQMNANDRPHEPHTYYVGLHV